MIEFRSILVPQILFEEQPFGKEGGQVNEVLRKILIAVLFTLIFSLSLAFWAYIPPSEQQAGVGYFSFIGHFIIYLIYSSPIYLIGGTLFSYFVDVCFDKIHFHNELLKYIIYFFIYIAGGVLVVGLLLIIIFLVDGNLADLLIPRFFLIGSLASLLFFHTSLVLNKTVKIYGEMKYNV